MVNASRFQDKDDTEKKVKKTSEINVTMQKTRKEFIVIQ
jgi:hypothetical protein